MSRLLLYILIVCNLQLTSLFAQSISSDSSAVQPISEFEILDKRFAFEDRETSIRLQLYKIDNVEIIQNDLAALKSKVFNTSESFNAIPDVDFTNLKIQKWERIYSQLSDSIVLLSNTINVATDSLIAYHSELNIWYKQWFDANQKFNNAKIPELLKQNIRDSKTESRALRSEIKQFELEFISLKYECNELLKINNDDTERLQKLKQEVLSNILVAEQPVIWEAFGGDTINSKSSISEFQLIEIVENSLSYIKSTPIFLVLGLVFFIILSVLFSWVSRQLAKSQIISEFNLNQISLAILRMPYVVSFLLTWVLLLAFFEVPIEPKSLILAMLILPLIFIISRVFQRLKVLIIIVFSAYYLFNLAGSLFNPLNFYTRLSFIILALLSLILFILLLRKSNVVAKVFKWGGFVNFIFYSIIILLAFAIVFLTIGNVNIGKLLLLGSIDVMLASVIFYVIYQLVLVYMQFFLVNNLVQKANIIRNHSGAIFKGLNKLLVLVSVIFWSIAVLRGFDLNREFIQVLKDIYFYEWTFGQNSIQIGHIIMFFVTIYLSILISRITILFLDEEVFPRSNTEKGVSNTISLLLRYSIIAIGFMLALTAAGINMSQISIIVGALGVGIGFGLQNIMNNLVSGIILALERPINIDDTIQVGELTGVVKSIGFRSSTVRTYDGADVIVPNGDIISNQMINWTLSDRKRRLRINLGVSYDADPNEVLAILNELAINHPDIEKEPLPRARFVKFGESSIDFQLLFWIADYENGYVTETDVLVQLFNILKSKGIKIPFPQRDLTIVHEFDNRTEEK